MTDVGKLGHTGSGRVAFSWNGLPQYAARLFRAAIERLGEPCEVIGSRPSVPVRGMEEALGQRAHWVDASKPITWNDLGLVTPDVFIQSGWSYPAFATLGRAVKAHGGAVIGLSDANWRGDFRQLVLGSIGFRLKHRRHFDAMLVPGKQGLRLMSYFGMEASNVRVGMLGADPCLFNGGAPLKSRSRIFLFVGQLIGRKDVLGLCRAFLQFCHERPGWMLQIMGSGEQRHLIPRDPRIIVEDFVQPEFLVERYRAARFLVLPSLKEAWGLVVHEAALCGCGLILSDAIGSGDDLADATNSVRFAAGNEKSLVRALVKAADLDDSSIAAAERYSRSVAMHFGPARFAKEACTLVEIVSKRLNA